MPMQATLSPALEIALDYYLRVLAISISYAGPVLLNYREELKHVIVSAFQAPSWKVHISSFSYIWTEYTPHITLHFKIMNFFFLWSN
jgi:proteasome activator subunit 4